MTIKKSFGKLIIGVIVILCGADVLFGEIFYSRGYPVPRLAGILIIIFGVGYILIEYFKCKNKGNQAIKGK
jgi:hypothetical protein